MRVPASFADELGRVMAASDLLMTGFGPAGDETAAGALAHYMTQPGRASGLPVLCIGAGRACEAASERLRPVAVAVDLLYFACVHHDDVADDGGTRHGKATINRAWSPGVGVWSGDVLFFRVFAEIHEHLPEGLRKTLGSLAIAAAADMQQFVHAGDVVRSEEIYFRAVGQKAGLLCGLACWLGASAAAAPSDRVRDLEAYGAGFGTAFQIADDARDYGARRTGGDRKEAGQDFAAGIVTLPVILAWRRGTAEERAFWNRALRQETREEGDFEQARELLARYDAIGDSLREARRYGEGAKSNLAAFRNRAADELAWLVDRYIADVEE